MLDKVNYPRSIKKQLLKKYLLETLKKRGITNAMFAEKLNKKLSEISKWFTTNHNFTIDTLFTIEDALDICLVITK